MITIGKDEVLREILQYFKVNECENKTYQHLWDAANIALRGKFIVLSMLTLKEMKGLKSII